MTKTAFTIEPTRQDIVMTRVFDAPREVVFKAYTDPEAIPQWWGPRRYTTTVDRMEPRSGGSWRFVQHDADGNQYAFHGVCHEVTPPGRIIQTFEWEGMPSHVALETAIFEEVDGKTRVTATSVFQTVEDRDAAAESGMQDGASETMDRLAELLAKRRQ